ncbi:MAG: hypothetical protein KO463_03070 [Candidatus Methanofastidiosa archaeon]|jgi:hypothetical protein|nr:hypothetical protein [Candidatus Methanofastidiosa archaeon]
MGDLELTLARKTDKILIYNKKGSIDDTTCLFCGETCDGASKLAIDYGAGVLFARICQKDRNKTLGEFIAEAVYAASEVELDPESNMQIDFVLRQYGSKE